MTTKYPAEHRELTVPRRIHSGIRVHIVWSICHVYRDKKFENFLLVTDTIIVFGAAIDIIDLDDPMSHIKLIIN